jgi:hypothetical protein
MAEMELAIGATLYFSFCGFLVFPLFNAPPLFAKMGIALCGCEFVVATLWAASRTSCPSSDCPQVVGMLSSAAGLELPALTALLFLIATGHAVFVARNW